MLCETCRLPNPPEAVACGRCGAKLAPGGAFPAAPPPGYGVPPGYGLAAQVAAPPVWNQLSGLGSAVTISLAVTAVSCVLAFVPGVGLVLFAAQLSAVVIFLIWFYRARQNADWTGVRQWLARAWAIWGWFVPVIFLWFPVRIMAGLWRASQEPAARTKPMLLLAAWWSCWLLAWFTGYRHITSITGTSTFQATSHQYGLYLEGTLPSRLFAAVGAVLLIVIVRFVSAGPLGAAGPPPPAQA